VSEGHTRRKAHASIDHPLNSFPEGNSVELPLCLQFHSDAIRSSQPTLELIAAAWIALRSAAIPRTSRAIVRSQTKAHADHHLSFPGSAHHIFTVGPRHRL
jgi:hypothetical protein